MMQSLILASQSHARKTMLRNAGLDFTCAPAHLDEDKITRDILQGGGDARAVAMALARAKALHIAGQNPSSLVIGSDQVLVHRGALLSKARDKNEAVEKLKTLRGDEHQLISAVAIARKDRVLWAESDQAILRMKNFSDEFLEEYARKAGDMLTASVGAYAIEGPGAWLFERVDGDFFTIMGMPLLPFLRFLETENFHP